MRLNDNVNLARRWQDVGVCDSNRLADLLHHLGMFLGYLRGWFIPFSFRTFCTRNAESNGVVIFDVTGYVVGNALWWMTMKCWLAGALSTLPVGWSSTNDTGTMILELGHCCFVLFKTSQVSTESV